MKKFWFQAYTQNFTWRRSAYINNFSPASAGIVLWKFNIFMEAQNLMAKKIQANSLEISEKQIEILARRLLPEIKKYFADENIRKEFEEWQGKRQGGK